MHSRIYQISTSSMTEDDYIGEGDLYEIMPSVMDYVNETTDREEDICWLGECEDWLRIEGDKLIITREGINAWFDDKQDKLRKALSNEISFSDWCSISYNIKSIIEDECGFYVYFEGWLMPFDRWVTDDVMWKFRDENVNEVVFYIGATIDYHS